MATPDLQERVSLETVLDELGTRTEIETRLHLHSAVSAYFRQWLINIYAERNLVRGTWLRFVERVLAVDATAGPAAVMEECTAFFQSQLSLSRALLGPLAHVDRSVHLGRVEARNAFEARIASVVGGSLTAAHDMVQFMIDRRPPTWEPMWLGHPVGKYLMWATFCEDRPDSDPFDSLPYNRELLRCVFGLPWDDGELVCLAYRLPDGTDMFVPTIVEAYAGGNWTTLFRPTESGAHFGRAMPRPDCDKEISQPEVVHRPVTLAAMTRSIRTA